jgi:hypothetical protein
MKPRELDLPFFEATLIPPVRRLTEDERPEILLVDYLHAALTKAFPRMSIDLELNQDEPSQKP